MPLKSLLPHFKMLFVSFQNSMTALIVAVKGGFTEVVKELLKRNPNVNMTDKDGNTALAIAAKEGHTEIVQDLLDAGTYVNIPDRVRPPNLSPAPWSLTISE